MALGLNAPCWRITNTMKGCLLGLFILIFNLAAEAQTFSRYIVQFSNKAGTPFSLSNPSAFLSQRAIDRRTRYGIALDSTDLPVPPRYIDSLRAAGAVTVLNVSKWLNQVSIQTTDASALQKIRSYNFVKSADPIAARKGNGTGGRQDYQLPSFKTRSTVSRQQPLRIASNFYDYGQSFNQIHIHNGEFLHNIGLRGQGMIIGMLDAGYRNYTSLRAFDSARLNGQILGTYDFVSREASVVEDHPHGMQCLSVIAANIPGQFIGSAPKASFYLFRTEEDVTEYPVEEHNWVCGAERLDSAGGDLISSSLGYTTFDNAVFNHTYADMNGNTTIAARGADMAAKKGVLVVNSAGNDGNNSWGKIATPADGDSVMAVGAVTNAGVPAGFSSRGPSSDGQVKPNVVSVGVATVIQTTSNTIGTSNGTSFSCPNIAGLAACLWQGFREFDNMKIINALQRASHRFFSPSDTVGYGIPDVRRAVLQLIQDYATASVTSSGCRNTLTLTSKDAAGMRYEIERRGPGETTFLPVLQQSGSGSTLSNKNYVFTDDITGFQQGLFTYRIRQVVDSTATGVIAGYIDTISVTTATGCVNQSENIVLSPNPARNEVLLRYTSPEAVPELRLHVYNAMGQLVYSRKVNKPAGVSSFVIPVSHLAPGSYYLNLWQQDRKISTLEFVKQ